MKNAFKTSIIAPALSTVIFVPFHSAIAQDVTVPSVVQSSEQGEMATKHLVLQNVNLIDGKGGGIREDVMIVITGGVIVAISDVTAPPELPKKQVTTIDLDGKYVMPGLIDAHVHLATDPDEAPYEDVTELLRSNLGNGILAVRDMAGDGRALTFYKRQTLTAQIPGPDIMFSAALAGPSFFIDDRAKASSQGVELGTASWLHEVTNDTDLADLMQRIKGIGATGIKLYFDIDQALTAKIAKEAKHAGLAVWSHWSIQPANAMDTVLAGIDVVSHAGMVEGVVDVPETVKSGNLQAAINANGGDELWAAMIENGTVLDATLAVIAELGDEIFDFSVALTKAAHNAGVDIAAGSDISGMDELAAGQVEFRMLAQHIGMSPAEVLNSAAIINASVLGIQEELGVIQPGKPASFLVYETMPLESVNLWSEPFYVVKRGVVYDGAQLRNSEETVTAVYSPWSNEAKYSDEQAPAIASLFKNMDTNGDLMLTLEEVPAVHKSRLSTLDQNGDGQVSMKEFNSGMSQ